MANQLDESCLHLWPLSPPYSQMTHQAHSSPASGPLHVLLILSFPGMLLPHPLTLPICPPSHGLLPGFTQISAQTSLIQIGLPWPAYLKQYYLPSHSLSPNPGWIFFFHHLYLTWFSLLICLLPTLESKPQEGRVYCYPPVLSST